jgi:hypothetical protein
VKPLLIFAPPVFGLVGGQNKGYCCRPAAAGTISGMDINYGTVGISLAANAGLFLLLLKLSWKTLSERLLANLTARNQQTLAGYQHELDKMILVTKVHFETEFAALKTVFQKLSEVRITMAGVRPMIGIAHESETKDDKLKALMERLRQFTIAYNALLETTENLSPFYPKQIYAYLEECRSAANTELMEVKTAGEETFGHHWYQDGDRNMQRFLKAYNTVADLIRDHIARLAIARQ